MIVLCFFLMGCTKDSYEIQGNAIVAYIGKETETTTPEDVSVIQSNAFSFDMDHGMYLDTIHVTSNIETIEEQAFAFCHANTIYIEEGVQTIGDLCFMDSYIKDIYFPASIKNVGKSIMETEEGLDGCTIHVKEGSVIASYFEKNMPYGDCQLVYDKEEKEVVSKISAEQAKEIMDSNQDIYIVDCRSEEEYKTGHIKNSILIPMSKMKEAESILTDKNKTILIYCRTGSRAGYAATQLEDMEYSDIRNFGGVTTWPYELVKE